MSSTDVTGVDEAKAKIEAHAAAVIDSVNKAAASGQAKTYTLHCHCKSNVFTIGPIPDIYSQECMSCNCSICNDRGFVMTYVPTDKIKTVKGGVEAGTLSEYQFNKKMIKWTFCKECGSTICGTPADLEAIKIWGVNTRCVEGVDVTKLKVTQHNGKDMPIEEGK